MHHTYPSGLSQPHGFGMMLECSTGESLVELLARAAFMHHDAQGYEAETASKG